MAIFNSYVKLPEGTQKHAQPITAISSLLVGFYFSIFGGFYDTNIYKHQMMLWL
jgi:hypothetical protein